ncbi:cellulase family glycosylhydrolase [Hoyosella sp. YIM 151337]|uniref:cellulase family glycosylhydrolase n=1 Tax=Hoyosella sp. YIM 151337 TaxID=2992742 RepID=UPI0022355094|nr:cellulase family glycosylhydrolase [Hoyosella sp. YIM 151337]MCW4353633.1 cellulase family glycosylhydrolase [Hoyosella sp. YIM 151337]
MAAALTALFAVAVSGCAADESPHVLSGSPRVAVQHGQITLDGENWWPTGVNAYQLGTDWDINIGCGAEVDAEEFFASLAPRSLTRFNAYQTLAIDRNTGEFNFAALDAVIAAAQKHEQLVIPVLTGQEGACENNIFKQRDWYVSGWRNSMQPAVPFAEWVVMLAERWDGSSAIAAWELIGEPETSVCAGFDCTLELRTCPDDSAVVLRQFVDEAGALLRGASPSHPITLGLVGGGQCGTAGADFEYVNESPYVDITQYHDYGADDEVLPGDEFDGLAARITQSRNLGKPLLVGEIGIPAGTCLPLERRADAFANKIRGQREAGTAGALLWAYVPDPRRDACTMDIGPDGPVWDMLESLW